VRKTWSQWAPTEYPMKNKYNTEKMLVTVNCRYSPKEGS